MNQYCYDLITDSSDIDTDMLKKHISNLYRKKKFKELAFTADEKLPFIVLYSQKDDQVCIKMTSKAKKNIDRIEGIHTKLTPADLKVDTDITLDKPFLYTLEQCAWWDTDCKISTGAKWSTLVHNGPYFVHLMEPYEPHGAPIIYDGKKYNLTPKEERIANFYARRIISEESGNVTQMWTKDKVFNQNFWDDFKTYLTADHKKIFKDFKKLDFTDIVSKLEELKELDKQLSDKQKTIKKVAVAEKKQNYGFAIINNIKEPLGNFTIEPAAIFYGRGDNPKRGKIKRDIEPEEVTINIGEEAPKPKPPKGHKWKEVIHDQNLAWVASWKDPISNENKYVYFAAEGQLKGKSDLYKYEKARKLNKYLDKVRDQYTADITSKLAKNRQLGTVLYLIDHHGIRVGNEKDESETDTVGASTLRVEHISLKPPNIIVVDFLGKDSIRYYKEIPVDTQVYENFEEFLSGKSPSDQLFDLISASDINAYLKTFDKDFSAKVFRTRLASTVMDAALKKSKVKKNATQDDKKNVFTKANIEVAKLLNHQRTVSAKAKDTIKKYQSELRDLRKELKEKESEGKSTKTLETRIKKKRDQIANKKDTLNIAINTSLTNYIDPRIVVSWAIKNDMNIPKAYTATLQRKFKWAIDITEEDWDYQDYELLPEMAQLNPVDSSNATPAPKAKVAPAPKKKAVPAPKQKPIMSAAWLVKQDLLKKELDAKWNVPAKAPAKAPAIGIQLVDYTAKSFAVIGDTKPHKETLMNLGGKFNTALSVDGAKVSGWIFSKKRLDDVESALLVTMNGEPVFIEPQPLVKQATEYQQSELASPFPDVSIIDYSPKSIAVIGNTQAFKEYLTGLGGRFNKALTIDGTKVSGWIFSKNRLEDVIEAITEAADEQSLKKITEPELFYDSLKQDINLEIVDYGKNIAIVGETEDLGPNHMLSKKLQTIKEGKYSSNIILPNRTTSGWIYPKTAEKAVKRALGIIAVPVKKTAYAQTFLPFPIDDIVMVDYSAKNIALVGNTDSINKYLVDLGGHQTEKLAIKKDLKTALGVKDWSPDVPGWVLPKIKLHQLEEILKQEKTWDDIMATLVLTQKERNIIKCFGRDPNVVNFLKSELIGNNVNKKIYSTEFLARFLACLDGYDKDTTIQQQLVTKYATLSHDKLAADIVSRLEPSTVPTFMFLIFILYKVSSRVKEQYLEQLMNHLHNTDEIQACLCDNSEDETLIDAEEIKNVPMKDLYLLPSGRCIHLDDLIMHLKASDNKITDPTYKASLHGKNAAPTWTNGWELKAMLERIQKYNYEEGSSIKQEFQKVLKDVAEKIPTVTKNIVTDVYPLFYFPEANNNQHLVKMLVKYGYPDGNRPGNIDAAKEIVAKGSGDQLDEFRTLLGFKLASHVLESLKPEQREAFLFAGEFSGMGREAWGKLSMGEFCTKTFGSILHRMAKLFAGDFEI